MPMQGAGADTASFLGSQRTICLCICRACLSHSPGRCGRRLIGTHHRALEPAACRHMAMYGHCWRRFVAREAELEASMGESAAALAAMQRSLEDRTRRATAAEERLSALEAEKTALSVSLSALQEQAAGR